MSVRRAWYRHALTVLRWTRALSYIGLAVSGFAALIHPPVSVTEASGLQLVSLVWAGMLGLAALVCLAGALTDRWVGEYIGLIPLSMSAAVFAISALSRGPTGIAGGAFLFGFFWFLASRWQEVALLRIESTRQAERRGEST